MEDSAVSHICKDTFPASVTESFMRTRVKEIFSVFDSAVQVSDISKQQSVSGGHRGVLWGVVCVLKWDRGA